MASPSCPPFHEVPTSNGPVDRSSAFRATFVLLDVSLVNVLLSWSLSFGGPPSLGRSAVVSSLLRLLKVGLNDAQRDVQGSKFVVVVLLGARSWSIKFVFCEQEHRLHGDPGMSSGPEVHRLASQKRRIQPQGRRF